ncbi:MAG: DUF1624 domain-containing protein [Clostridia bacterium]|nr:DUF1624 domain-containing protein [Clostridia bacterium]
MMTDINSNDISKVKHVKKRVYMLDILRGAAVLGMVLHHALVSFEIIFEKSFEILYSEAFLLLQLLFVAVFLLVSGICTNYSRSVLKRGLIVFAAALVVSFATCVVMPAMGFYGLNIYFGILHMIGLSMILYALLKRWLDKIKPPVGIVLFTVLFVAYYMFYRTEPTGSSYFLMIFGILPQGIGSYGDYYPLFPYLFLFLVGTYVGKYIKNGVFPKWFYTKRCVPLEICGKYSLWVYVLHQPVIFGIMYAVSAIIK